MTDIDKSPLLLSLERAQAEKLDKLPMDLHQQVEIIGALADYFGAAWLKIGLKEAGGGLAPFVFNAIQMDHLKHLRKHNRRRPGVDQFRGTRDLILKPRRLGFSTYIAALYFMDGFHNPGTNTVVMAHTEDVVQELFEIYRIFYETLPDDVRDRVKTRRMSTSSMELLFYDEHGELDLTARPPSSFNVATAGGKDKRGVTPHNLHLCLGPDTVVIGKDGFPFPITSPPASVRDGKGSMIQVHSVSTTSHVGESALRLTVHGCTPFPLTVTHDHRLLIRDPATKKPVWKRADEITKEDYVGFPRTKVGTLVSKVLSIPHQKNSMKVPNSIDANAELGALLGWFLAEGCALWNGDRASGISLGIDRDEKEEVLAVVRPFVDAGYFTSLRTDDHCDSRTTAIALYGRCFAEFLIGLVGEKETKRIPDGFFRYPTAFLWALLRGLLDGDGCYTNPRCVSFCTTRPQLAIQMKRLALHLRIGMVSIYRVGAAIRHGRNEKEQWIVQFLGPANVKLRRKFGKPLPPRGKMLQAFLDNHPGHPRENWSYGRHSWRRGTTHYWSKVKKIETVSAPPEMFDLCLAEDPHSYCTMAGVVHNSECAFYENWSLINRSIVQAVDVGGNVILESTARGFNHYKDLVDAALSGRSQYRLVFYPWFAFPDYRSPLDPGQTEVLMRTLDRDEEDLVQRGVGADQLAWRRWKLTGMDMTDFHQEFPASILEAFVSTGRPAFDQQVVVENWEKSRGAADRWTKRDDYTTIFFPPEPGAIYVLSADPAEGIDKGEGDARAEIGGTDYSSASVRDAATLRVMATIHGRIDPPEFAGRCADLGLEYNEALIVVERNNHGGTVLFVLEQAMYPNLYRHQEYDAAGQSFSKLGFPMTPTTRPLVIDALREVIKRNALPNPDANFWKEASFFTYNALGKPEAMQSRHDDRVMDHAIGTYVCTIGAKAWGGDGLLQHVDSAGLPLPREFIAPRRPANGPIVVPAPPAQRAVPQDAPPPIFGMLQQERDSYRASDIPRCGNCDGCPASPDANGNTICTDHGFQVEPQMPSCMTWRVRLADIMEKPPMRIDIWSNP